MRRPGIYRLLVVAMGLLLIGAVPVAADEPTTPALFEGRIIDLAESWEGAQACLVDDRLEMVLCFASEAELEAELVTLAPQPSTQATCSSSLRLYANTWYSGSVLYLSSRGSWLNLSNYGFNQTTSSFKIGACNAWFADLANGGGAHYTYSHTQAWDQSGAMNAGWDNDVSSVYIW